MHPEIAKTLVTHHRDELAQDAAACRRVGRRRFPGGTSAGRGPCWPRPSRRARQVRTAPARLAGAVRRW